MFGTGAISLLNVMQVVRCSIDLRRVRNFGDKQNIKYLTKSHDCLLFLRFLIFLDTRGHSPAVTLNNQAAS